MKITRAIPALLLLAVLLLSACGKVPATHFYTLEPPALTSLGKPPLPYDVAVARFRAPFRLAQDRLVYMASAYDVDYYNYHRWAGYPADLVTQGMISSLKHAGMFRSVSEMRSGASPDYILRGEIQNLEELDNGSAVSARVAMTLDVTDARTRTIVWSGAASVERPVNGHSVDDVARELHEGVRQSLEKLTRDLAAGFPERK